jgi:DNA-binding LacI/PurR family transcriptional regulator
MGEAAVKLLLGQLSGEEGLKSVLIDGTFISRSSV